VYNKIECCEKQTKDYDLNDLNETKKNMKSLLDIFNKKKIFWISQFPNRTDPPARLTTSNCFIFLNTMYKEDFSNVKEYFMSESNKNTFAKGKHKGDNRSFEIGPRIELLYVVIKIILHELSHCLRLKIDSKMDYFSTTPENRDNEAGDYFENQTINKYDLLKSGLLG